MRASLLLVALLAVPLAGAQDSTGADPRAGAARWPSVDADLLMANVYESNIEHDPEAVPSVGVVPALHLRLGLQPAGALVTVDYVLARHSYSNTERWDRTSHQVRAAYEREVAENLTSVTEAEVSLRGSSEDRDLANQVQFVQAVEWKLSRAVRAEAYGTLRYKTVPASPADRAFKPNVGLVLQRRWDSGARVEVGGRGELNMEPDARGTYRRLTLTGEVRLPLAAPDSRVEVDGTWRVRLYPNRIAEDADGDALDLLRLDRQWSVGAAWHRPLLGRLALEVGGEVERRTSTDADKHYTAASARVGVAYRL